MPDQVHLEKKRYSLTAMLGDAGSLPFIMLAGLMVFAHLNGAGLESVSLAGLYPAHVFIAYSAVILTFLGGALWERSRRAESGGSSDLAKAMIVLSNFVALTAWACLLLASVGATMMIFAVCLLAGGFLSLLWADVMTESRYFTLKLLSSSYGLMRVRITSLVVLLHILVAALMFMELNV
jgi:hypothetical protein